MMRARPDRHCKACWYKHWYSHHTLPCQLHRAQDGYQHLLIVNSSTLLPTAVAAEPFTVTGALDGYAHN